MCVCIYIYIHILHTIVYYTDATSVGLAPEFAKREPRPSGVQPKIIEYCIMIYIYIYIL